MHSPLTLCLSRGGSGPLSFSYPGFSHSFEEINGGVFPPPPRQPPPIISGFLWHVGAFGFDK